MNHQHLQDIASGYSLSDMLDHFRQYGQLREPISQVMVVYYFMCNIDERKRLDAAYDVGWEEYDES